MTEKTKFYKTWWFWTIIVLIVGVIIYLSLFNVGYNYSPISQTLIDETSVLEEGEYSYLIFNAEAYDNIEVNIEVKEGGAVDVLLMDAFDFNDFGKFMDGERDTFEHYVTGSALKVKSKTYLFQIPKSGTYYIVTNNAGGIERGAYSLGQVSVYLKVIATY